MSRPGQDFIPLDKPTDARPPSAFFGPGGALTLVRDQLTISTWLSLGAILQGTLFLIAGRISLLPALLLILYRVFDAYAQAVGWKHNTYMNNIIMKKVSGQFPDAEGNYGAKPCNEDVVVFLIGMRCNHPYGMLAPGFKELGDYFISMTKHLDAQSEEYGYLGSTSWLNSAAKTSGNEVMVVCYFRNPEGLHKFAHGDLHRKGWDWWNRTIKQHPHLSIWHETYHVPKGHWESIHVNSHRSGINTTAFKVFDSESGTEKWANPMVDASRGLLKTSAGRMSRSKGEDHDQYGADPYEKY